MINFRSLAKVIRMRCTIPYCDTRHCVATTIHYDAIQHKSTFKTNHIHSLFDRRSFKQVTLIHATSFVPMLNSQFLIIDFFQINKIRSSSTFMGKPRCISSSVASVSKTIDLIDIAGQTKHLPFSRCTLL